MTTLLAQPVPHTAAADIIKGSLPVTRDIFDGLLPELQSRAFTVTGIESVKVLERVRDLTSELPLGGDWDDLKSQVLDEISPWLITAAEPEEIAKQLAAATRRAELILRNNGWAAYATTNHQAIAAQSDAFPFCEYITSEDGRVRASHAKLNGKIVPTDDPFWETHTPPWEHGCRCDKVPRLAEDVDEIREEEKSKLPEERSVIEGSALEILHNGNLITTNGSLLDIRTPREKNGRGYEFRPGTLALSFDDILSGYPPSAAETFRKWATATVLDDGRTLAESLGGAATQIARTPAIAKAVLRKSPVSSALTLKIRDKAPLRDALEAIDSVHDDGVLPTIPVDGTPGRDYLGVYRTRSNKAASIGVSAKGSWPRLTAVHEIGHFIDHQALHTAGRFASEDPASGLGSIISLLRATPTFAALRNAPKPSYWQSGRELFARAYAQYIAIRSQHPALLAELRKCQGNPYQPWRQWSDAEFAPIALEIDALLKSKNWTP